MRPMWLPWPQAAHWWFITAPYLLSLDQSSSIWVLLMALISTNLLRLPTPGAPWRSALFDDPPSCNLWLRCSWVGGKTVWEASYVTGPFQGQNIQRGNNTGDTWGPISNHSRSPHRTMFLSTNRLGIVFVTLHINDGVWSLCIGASSPPNPIIKAGSTMREWMM